MLTPTPRQQRLAQVDALRARLTAIYTERVEAPAKELRQALEQVLDEIVAELYSHDLDRQPGSTETIDRHLGEAARKLAAIERVTA
jgi:hypothetical protein